MTRLTSRYFAICAIVREEDEYLDEWVAFHLAIGAEKIFIIDNASRPSAHIVLANYITTNTVEVLRFTSRLKPQREAYNRALRYLSGRFRWVAFIDVDEFLFPACDEPLHTILENYEDFAGVAVNWVSFGSSGHVAKPHGWVTENFTERGPLNHALIGASYNSSAGAAPSFRPINSHVKCIVDPAKTLYFRTAHHFRYSSGNIAVTENFEPISGPFSRAVSVGRLRINHYWSKSLEDLENKIRKGRVSQASGRKTSGYDRDFAQRRELASRGVSDNSIARYLQEAHRISVQYSEEAIGARDIRLKLPKRLRYSLSDWVVANTRILRNTLRKIAR